jgi:hypothetical protein
VNKKKQKNFIKYLRMEGAVTELFDAAVMNDGMKDKKIRLVCSKDVSRLALRLLLAGLLLGGLCFSNRAALADGRDNLSQKLVAAYPDSSLINLSGTIYEIPKQYTNGRISSHLNDGHNGLFMMFLLPDLEGENSANQSEFELHGWRRQMLVAMNSPMPDPLKSTIPFSPGIPDEKTEASLKGENLMEVGPGVYDLKRKFLLFDLYALVEDKKVIAFIQCMPFSLMGRPLSPYCQFDENIHGVIRLRWSFSRSFVGNTKEIHDGVVKLIASFEIRNGGN